MPAVNRYYLRFSNPNKGNRVNTFLTKSHGGRGGPHAALDIVIEIQNVKLSRMRDLADGFYRKQPQAETAF